MAWWLALLAVLAGVGAVPQSNYNLQNLDVEFEEGEGIPEFGTLDGIVTELGKIYNMCETKYYIHCPTSNHNNCIPIYVLCIWYSIVLIAFHCLITHPLSTIHYPHIVEESKS